MNKTKVVCVLILQYNSAAMTLQLLESIVAHESDNLWRYRFIVMDNASDDPQREKIAGYYPFVEFVQYDENLGFAKAHNRITPSVNEPWLLLLNNDCILLNNAIERLLESAEEEDVDFATCEVFNSDGTPQKNYSYLPSPLRRIAFGFTGLWRLVTPIVRRMETVRVGYINGAVLLIRRDVFSAVGMFDERYFMYREDFDLMLKLWKHRAIGRRLRGGRIVHLGGESAGKLPSSWEAEQKYSGDWILWYKDYFPHLQVKLFALTELVRCILKRKKSILWRYRCKAALRTLRNYKTY